MKNLRNEIIEIVETTKNFRTVSKINFLQLDEDDFYRTITKKKVQKLNLGKLIGLRIYDEISDSSYDFGEIVTRSKWIFKNGESY
jgi:hypothetical protein